VPRTTSTDAISGVCARCGCSLERAIVRAVRHYEETRLIQDTCGRCEQSFLCGATDKPRPDAISFDDVIVGAQTLDQASSLSQLFGPGPT
jgi:hypothetical protein